MQEQHSGPDDAREERPGLLRTPWRNTILAVAFGVLVLGYEYREAILTSGLLVYLPILLCVGMHFFMHRGHKGNGRHGDGG